MEDVDEATLQVITTSNEDIIQVLNQCSYYVLNPTEGETQKNNNPFHLREHNYFNKRPASEKPRKRHVKITQLRAVYNCVVCGYKSMKREVFSNHNCKKKPNFISCTLCAESDKKNAPKGYEKCPQCTYFTKSKASLKLHMHIHSNGTPYKCTECEFYAKDLKDLIRHYKITKDLKCDCGYSTHMRTRMVTHTRAHSGEKPFSCGICNFSTADRSGLHKHMKRHEPI